MFGPFNTNNFLSPQFNTQYHQTQLNQNAASGPLNLPHPIPQNGYSAHSRTMPNSMLPPTAVPHNYIPQWYPPPHTSYQTLQPPPLHQDRRGHSLSGGSESDRISPSNSSHSNDNNDHWQPLNIKHERMEPITDPRLLQHHHGFAHNANVHQDMPGDISTPREHYNNGYVSIPGLNFDAKNRRFTDDELRPQPIIRKRKKQFVPDNMKDVRYWEKRRKNNEAARMSREAKRQKENQIIMRAAHLEVENKDLRTSIKTFHDENDVVRRDVKILAKRLAIYQEKEQNTYDVTK